jgi:hypothetical protein
MMKKVSIILAISFMILTFMFSESAAVDPYLNYQGFLTDHQGIPLDTVVTIHFNVYTQSVGGSPLWNQTATNVSVNGGHFVVILGPFDAELFLEDDLYIGVTVGDDNEMAPRREFTCSAQSFISEQSVSSKTTTGIAWDYDSGWINMSLGQVYWAAHNLGGDPGEYFVYLVGRNGSGVHNANYGTYNPAGQTEGGGYWYSLSASSIGLYRGHTDFHPYSYPSEQWTQIRVRILKNQ